MDDTSNTGMSDSRQHVARQHNGLNQLVDRRRALALIGSSCAVAVIGGAAVTQVNGASGNESECCCIDLPTYAELRAETMLNSTRIVRGRNVDGDRGEGTFIWRGGNQAANVSNDPLSGVWVSPNSDASGASGAWKRVYSLWEGFKPEWFGAKADGTSDDKNAIQACIDFAIKESLAATKGLPYAAGLSNRPAALIQFDGNGYRISGPIEIHSLGEFEFRGGLNRTTIIADPFQDYMIKVSNRAYNVTFGNITFASTRVGCVDFNCIDRSGSMVLFENCQFIGFRDAATGDDHGTAIRYLNRSSSLIVRRCFFYRIKYAFDQLNNDFLEFDGCWFDAAFQAVYSDGDAYIKITKGYVRIHDCLFAAGPQNGRGGAKEVAYINLGNPGHVYDGVEHAQLLISNTRIGFEVGAGSIVNYKAENRGTLGSAFRSGVTFRDVITSPREGKVDTINGVQHCPTVRLFTTPHYLHFENIQYSQGIALLIGAGTGTDLTSIREAMLPTSYVQDFSKYRSMNSTYTFTAKGINTPLLYAAATTNKVEYNKWAELFGLFDYFFESNSSDSQMTAIIDTFYGNFTDQRGGLFYVKCSAHLGGATPYDAITQAGNIILETDGASDQIIATWHSNIRATGTSTVSGVNRDITITPVFVVSGIEKISITLSEASTAKLRLKVTETTGGTLRCTGANVIPHIRDLESIVYKGGFIQG